MALIETREVSLPEPNYEYVTTEEAAHTALSDISRFNCLAVDTECTHLDPFYAKVSLVQIGTPEKAYVFDVRSDTQHSSVDVSLLKPVLVDPKIQKIVQNSVFDMKLLKYTHGFYINNIYDTMLAEQLFNLGRGFISAALDKLVLRYLGITMPKEPANTFKDYNQTFKPYQLVYAANDVVVLDIIKQLQQPRIVSEGLEDAARLEFEFTKPMCEMELNGIKIDVEKWRLIMADIEAERQRLFTEIGQMLSSSSSQGFLFGVPSVNIDSPIQLKEALGHYGLSNLDSTDEAALMKFQGVPVIDALLKYRKASKLVSTYGEALLEKIHKITGRLHTEFKQMVSTGRMSSSNPNLQNIPKKQLYRSCFIAEYGKALATADMSGAELRILGNLSEDPVFIECYANGIDLHTRTSSEVFGVPMEEVKKDMRNAAKAINFGLCYGLSKYGLARRLKISEKKAEEMIETYFQRYVGVKRFLERSAKEAVMNRFSRSISGRKRYYNLPEYGDPDFGRIKASIERQAKNAPIQGSNADTIKQAMIYLVDRLEDSAYDAKLILTVHDEVVVECDHEDRHEVGQLVAQALVDGFGHYFHKIPMETDALIGPCWLKSECEGCGGDEMTFVPDDKYKTKLVCMACGEEI